MPSTKRLLVISLAAFLFTPVAAYSTNGYMSHGYGIASKGMAGAGMALPQDSLSMFSNPAGLTRLGKRLDAELEFFSPDRQYKANADFAPPPSPSVPPGRYKSDNDLFLIPGFGVNLPLDDKSTIGIALAGQGGMNTEYDTATFTNFAAPSGSPQNPTGEFTATEPTGVDLAQMALGITYARELPPFEGLGITRQSIGITPIVAVQRFKATGLQPFRALSVSPDNVTNNGYDYSYGGGARIGWLASLLHDQLNIGVSYQSKLWMSDFSKYKGLFASGGSFDIPATVNAGLAFMLTPKLTVAADFRRIFYSDIDALSNPNDISFDQIAANPNTRLGGDKGLGFGWQDINVYSIGMQYQLNEKWTLRAGYSKGDVPWKNVNTLFNILAPATIETHASLGGSYRLNRKSSINFAYTHAFTNTVQGTSTFTGPQTGYVRMQQNMLQIGYSRELGIQ
jgi:long-chain fatty acid transport protein